MWAHHQLHLVVEVFRVRNKSLAIFVECKPFFVKASSFGLCEMASNFKARINRQSNRTGNLKGVAGFKKQAEL